MKVSYANLAPAPSYLLLFSEGVTTTAVDTAATGPTIVPEFSPRWRQGKQEDQLYGSATMFRKARGNVSVSMTLKFGTVYATRADCLASVRAWRTALVGQLVHLKVEQDGEVQYYPNALVEDYNPTVQGQSAVHTFSFTSDDVTTTPP